MNGRFRLTDVLRIQLVDDGNTISTKYYDYCPRTISQLIENGKHDTSGMVKRDLVTELMELNETRNHQLQLDKTRVTDIQTELNNGRRKNYYRVDEIINEIKSLNDNRKMSERANQLINIITG
jgi:hypothetical protein